MKRLSGPSGQLISSSSDKNDGAEELERDAILVHAGPEGTSITFLSGDGEIKFDEERIMRIVRNQNQKVETLAKGYGGLAKMPVGAHTAILDQHQDDSNDRIRGRLVSMLRFEKRDVPGVGKDVPCAIGRIRFLGQETVQKVNDGRIYHLSVGIHEDSDTLGEVSTVIEPAAPGAMLLSAKKGGTENHSKGGSKMSAKLKRLQANRERVKRLEAISTELKTMGAKAEETKKLVSVTREKVDEGNKVANVTSRLHKLMAAHKMAPVEFKALDIKKLSAMKPEDLDVVFAGYEARTVIEDKRQFGTADAIDFTSIGKGLEKDQMKRLKSEVKSDMARLSGKKLKSEDKDTNELGGGNKESAVHPGKGGGAVPGEGGDEEQLKKMKGHMESLKACLEKGDVEGAKKAHLEMSKHVEEHGMKHMSYGNPGDVKSEDAKKNLDSVQGQIDELNTNMARLAGMVGELMDVEKAEGHELEAKVAAEGGEKPGAEKPAPPAKEEPAKEGEKPAEPKKDEEKKEDKPGEGAKA